MFFVGGTGGKGAFLCSAKEATLLPLSTDFQNVCFTWQGYLPLNSTIHLEIGPGRQIKTCNFLKVMFFCDFCQFSVFSFKAQSRFWIRIKSKAGKEKTERLRNKDITSSARGLDGCFKVHGVLTVVATKRMLYKSTCPSKLRSVGGTKRTPALTWPLQIGCLIFDQVVMSQLSKMIVYEQ